MLNIYQELLMDHYRTPRNRGTLQVRSFCATQRNSSCGDEVCFMGAITENMLTHIAFEGKGCVVSQATASMLSESVVGKCLDEIMTFDKEMILAMIGMQLGPVRLMCALLPLMALQEGVKQYKQERSSCLIDQSSSLY